MAEQFDTTGSMATREPPRVRQLRQSKRRGLSMMVNLVVDGVVSHVTLENVSTTGMGLRGWCDLTCDHNVVLQLPDGRSLAANVCWVGKGRIGIKLLIRLRQDDPLLQADRLVNCSEPRQLKPVLAIARVPFRRGTLASSGASSSASQRILVAETFRSVGCLMKSILETTGNIVDVVDNGLALVEAARRNVYDVVMIDSQLELMTAAVAATTIRRLAGPFGQCSIIAVSAMALDERSMAAVFDGQLIRPIRPTALLEQVAAVRAVRADPALHNMVARVSNAA